ncbi:MAG: electron transfer flavoprotein subunit alpha/FixB family protein [Candidatus Brocadiales bacterium]|nr:electron transfer flavoprotein subunit alpha/FixB family protein [Candidatus Brocadiales bacterium]
MIFTFSEDYETALEILAKGREIADSLRLELAAISIGKHDDIEDTYIFCGADKVYSIDSELHADIVVDCLCSLINQYKPELLLIGGTRLGKEVAPRIAQKFGVGCAMDCIDFSLEQEKLIVKRFVLGGRFIATQRFLRKPQIVTVSPRRFGKRLDTARTGEIIKTTLKLAEPRVHILEIKDKTSQMLRIEEVDIIVSAGRGVKRKDDLKLIESLAKVLGGAVGCSRSVAADLKWLPEEHWVGLSGHRVKPKLYIAIGISGQVQHIAGMRDSKTIIAINSDPNAPIFKACDYGIVGDLYEIVPKLIEILQ